MSASRFGATRRVLAPRDSRDSRFEQPCRRPAGGGVARGVSATFIKVAEPRQKAGVCRSFDTTTVREQHPRSHHKGATRIQTHPAVREDSNLRLTGSNSMSLPTRTRHPLSYATSIQHQLEPITQAPIRTLQLQALRQAKHSWSAVFPRRQGEIFTSQKQRAVPVSQMRPLLQPDPPFRMRHNDELIIMNFY